MRIAPILIIYRKELRETFRDRRTLFMMLGLPLVLYPALGLIFLFTAQSTIEGMAKLPTRVAVIGAGESPKRVTNELSRANDISITAIESLASEAEALALVRQDAIDVAVVLVGDPIARIESAAKGRTDSSASPVEGSGLIEWGVAAVAAQAGDPRERTASGERVGYRLLYSDVRERSQQGSMRVAKALEKIDQAMREAELTRHGQRRSLAAPTSIAHTNVATKHEVGGHLAARILPIMLISMLILGAFYPAVELTAGEKERGTLETLLTAPVTRLEIVAGKYLTVVTLSLASAMANLVSLSLTVAHAISQIGGSDATFSLDASQIGVVFITLIPTALFIAAIMMIVASFARSFKDAQNLLTPVMLILIVPAALLSGLPSSGGSMTGALVPVLNVVMLTREILEGRATFELVALVFLASSLFSAAALVLAARVFETESVYFSGRDALRDLFRPPAAARLEPSAEVALVFAVVAFLLLYYLGSWLGKNWLVPALVLTPVLCALLPAMLTIKLMRLDSRSTLWLNRPTPRDLVTALLCGASTWFVAAHLLVPLQNLIMPIPEGASHELETLGRELLTAFGDVTPLVMGIVPAICEELAFRGLILRGLMSRFSPRTAVILSSIVFGALHLSPYRFLSSFLLGLLLGALTARSRSIIPAIVVHAGHNCLAVVAIGLSPDVLLCAIFGTVFVAGLTTLAWRRPR